MDDFVKRLHELDCQLKDGWDALAAAEVRKEYAKLEFEAAKAYIEYLVTRRALMTWED